MCCCITYKTLVNIAPGYISEVNINLFILYRPFYYLSILSWEVCKILSLCRVITRHALPNKIKLVWFVLYILPKINFHNIAYLPFSQISTLYSQPFGYWLTENLNFKLLLHFGDMFQEWNFSSHMVLFLNGDTNNKVMACVENNSIS